MRYTSTLLSKIIEIFDEDAQAWGLSRRRALLIALVPIVIVGVVTLIAGLALISKAWFRPIFRFITAEDSLLEWAQFLFVLLASLIFGWMGVQFMRKGQWTIGALYLLLGLCAFFVSGEEISWGQRIFGWGEPQALGAINHQKELNVHNIRPVQRAFGFVVWFGGMYGVFVPLIAKVMRSGREYTPLGFMLVPPLFLVPAFLMPFGYRLFRLVLWPGTNALVVRYGEAPEACLYFGLFMFAALNLWRLRRERPALVVRAAPAS